MTQNQLTQYAPCPNCGSTNATKIKFTWWGGALGPSMFTHVKCNDCNTQYNGKTGKSNTTNVIIYFAVSFAIGLCLCIAISVLPMLLNN